MAKLHFRYAAMNAGKSTQLLQIAHNYETLGKPPLLLTAAVDDRFGVGRISSRLGPQHDAEVFHRETDLFKRVDAYARENAGKIGAILVDEAQFMTREQAAQLHRGVHTFKVPVICFGLRSDFQGMPFEGAAMLLTLAEDIEEVKNICSCGSKATMNMRVDAGGNRVRTGPQVEIGDARYHQTCAGCFYS